MDIYWNNCKRHTECTHPKKMVLISDKKVKAKSKFANFLTDRAFFNKINDKYDLEQLVKHFFSLMYVIKEHGDLLCKVWNRN